MKIRITITLRFHLIRVRMVTIKNTNNKCWWGCGDKRILLHCWWECKLVQPVWRTLWKLLKKLKIDLKIWSSNSTSKYILEGM
jgi:hypothetical protein